MASLVLRHAARSIQLSAGLPSTLYIIRSASTSGIEILTSTKPEHGSVLTSDALNFVTDIHRRFEPTRQELLTARATRQAQIDAGKQLLFR